MTVFSKSQEIHVLEEQVRAEETAKNVANRSARSSANWAKLQNYVWVS
jgi:hypothetical protein